MKDKFLKTKLLLALSVLVVLVALGKSVLAHCPVPPQKLNIDSTIPLEYLYPWPDAKLPLACHISAFLKSPFAPRMLKYTEDVFKEDGLLLLGGHGRNREGVIVANIAIIDELYHAFPEPVKLGNLPPFARSTSIFVDGKKLRIGHIAYKEFSTFEFTTILNPFLLPGEHVGKIVILLPSGETMEYEWQFEITWW